MGTAFVWSSMLGFKLAQRQAVLDHPDVAMRLGCRASRNTPAVDLCGQPARWLLTAGCAHEHIVPSLACEQHADQVRRAGPRACVACKRAESPHACPVIVEFHALARKAA